VDETNGVREAADDQADAERGRFSPDPARIAAGWTPRFAVGLDRLDEVTRLYRELGFDVVSDPVRPEDAEDDCRDCRLLALARFRFIYTRRAAASPGQPEARTPWAGSPSTPRAGVDETQEG